MKSLVSISLIVLLVTAGAVVSEAKTQREGKRVVSLFSGFPTDTGTDDPMDAWPLLGAAVEYVLPNGLGLGLSLRYSQWDDYMGMYTNVMGEFCGAWSFRTWTPSFYLSYHFNVSRLRIVDPYAGIGVGVRLTRFENEMTDYSPPDAAKLDSQAFVRGFAGIRFYPFSGAAGFMRNFAFLVQVNLYLGGDFRPVTVMLGISQRF